jgi:diguanylate cyclase (GGDEF)-like protein
VRTMRADLQRLAEARSAIEISEAEHRAAAEIFSDTNTTVRAVLARVARATASRRHVREEPNTQPIAMPPPPLAAIPDGATRSVEVESTPPSSQSRYLIAWLTGGVLAALVIISVATVLSIVRPVRRMLAATAQLARGEAVIIPRGGIKELDTLAAAFNQMAHEVTATRDSMRDYQSQLEARVEERTRQLQELAEQDPLTQLPNRRQFFVNLDAALARAAADRVRLGVFFVDLDNFKHINDSMGHAFGDRIILAVAEKLRKFTQQLGFAARLGGDEFTIVMTRATTAAEIEAAGQALIAAFHQPLLLDNRELVLSVSIGASVYPDHEQTADSLLRAADVALFRAKTLGRSQLAMFTPELLATAAAKFTTEQGLRHALEHGEFELVFQPELSAETFSTALVEALIRWRTADGRLVSPAEFLAVAEESGLIIEISDWVLQAAIQAAARWHHGAWPKVCVAINVSPRQLLDTQFVVKVMGLLQQFNLPPSCIEIELTETVVQTSPRIVQTLRRLHAHGIAIALDDFGTGYSSLSSLEQLPLTRIKLDRSLIARIDTNARSLAITQAIIAMCKGLALKVTAEGIERPEQFNLLVQHRAMYLQGYLLSRPVAESEVIVTLERAGRRARLLTEANAAALLRELPAGTARAQS